MHEISESSLLLPTSHYRTTTAVVPVCITAFDLFFLVVVFRLGRSVPNPVASVRPRFACHVLPGLASQQSASWTMLATRPFRLASNLFPRLGLPAVCYLGCASQQSVNWAIGWPANFHLKSAICYLGLTAQYLYVLCDRLVQQSVTIAVLPAFSYPGQAGQPSVTSALISHLLPETGLASHLLP